MLFEKNLFQITGHYTLSFKHCDPQVCWSFSQETNMMRAKCIKWFVYFIDA